MLLCCVLCVVCCVLLCPTPEDTNPKPCLGERAGPSGPTCAGYGPTRPDRRGSHTTARELQTCTFERPGASNTTKIPRKRPKEREKRMKTVAGEEKKSAKFWAPTVRAPTVRAPTVRGPTLRGPTLRGPTLRGPTCSRFGPPTLRAPNPSGPPPFGATTLRPHPSGPHPSGPHFSGFGPPTLLGPTLRAPPFWAPMGETLKH